MNEFLNKVAEILEVTSVTRDTLFREVTDWSSLKGFGLLVMLENDYGKPMPIDTFLACRTVGDLANFAGLLTAS